MSWWAWWDDARGEPSTLDYQVTFSDVDRTASTVHARRSVTRRDAVIVKVRLPCPRSTNTSHEDVSWFVPLLAREHLRLLFSLLRSFGSRSRFPGR